MVSTNQEETVRAVTPVVVHAVVQHLTVLLAPPVRLMGTIVLARALMGKRMSLTFVNHATLRAQLATALERTSVSPVSQTITLLQGAVFQ